MISAREARDIATPVAADASMEVLEAIYAAVRKAAEEGKFSIEVFVPVEITSVVMRQLTLPTAGFKVTKGKGFRIAEGDTLVRATNEDQLLINWEI